MLNPQDYKLLYRTDQVLDMDIALSCQHRHTTGDDGATDQDKQISNSAPTNEQIPTQQSFAKDTSHSYHVPDQSCSPVLCRLQTKAFNKNTAEKPAVKVVQQPLIQPSKLGIVGRKIRRASIQAAFTETLLDQDEIQEISPKYKDYG